jgi:hypothetical protein
MSAKNFYLPSIRTHKLSKFTTNTKEKEYILPNSTVSEGNIVSTSAKILKNYKKSYLRDKAVNEQTVQVK